MPTVGDRGVFGIESVLTSLLRTAGRPLRVLALGAHCDDVEIGCGGTLASAARLTPRPEISIVLFSSDDTREREARASTKRLFGADAAVTVHRFRNGYFPHESDQIKDRFEELKAMLSPDLIFTHALHDRHQDHRVVGELTWNTFRNHLILEMEIAKYEGDLGQPNTFFPLERAMLDEKVQTLLGCYPTQRSKTWFSEETFRALARLRGIECNSPSGYAEAFHCRKLITSFQ